MFFCKNHKIKLISLNHVQLLSRGKSENLEVLIKKKKKHLHLITYSFCQKVILNLVAFSINH